MMQLARDIALLALAGLTVAGCATRSDIGTAPVVVRSNAPVKYEATVNSYFDFTAPPAPGPRKLAFGTPEASPCAIYGGGGKHASWVVPVIYDTSPPIGVPTVAGAPPVKGATDKNGKAGAAKAAAAPALKTSTSGTAAAAAASKAGAIPLNEVSITGIRYFFWFSSETLSAVTRQADLCP
jgi:hypothetical protein